MPRWSKTIQWIAPDGSNVTGIVCGSSPRRRCSVPNCPANATLQCDFPVRAPSRKSTTCDRWLCREHSRRVGPDRDYCPPHVRADQALRSHGGVIPTPSLDEPVVVVGGPVQLELAPKKP